VSSGVNHFEQFLAAQFPNFNTSGEVVLELSRGLANGNLFQNFGNNTFIVNGEILHGNTVKEVTNTYNLTISPRG
jgi:N-acetylneuraminic acid mutarotase